MEKREFNIEIFKWAKDWWISVKEFDFNQQNKYDSGNFGAKSGIKDKKIVYIFNNGIDEDFINEYKDEDILKEIVFFTSFVDEKEKERFQGTFIDALKYIQKVLNGR